MIMMTIKEEIRHRLERHVYKAVVRWTADHEVPVGPEPAEDPNRNLEIRRALRRLGKEEVQHGTD